MKALPMFCDFDRAFWVTHDVFYSEFNQKDFYFRNKELVDNNYSKHWFFLDKSGVHWFLLPTIQMISGSTQFINGRHRTAVLIQNIDRLPMAFSGGGAIAFAKSLRLEPIADICQIEFPDLPIVDRPEC